MKIESFLKILPGILLFILLSFQKAPAQNPYIKKYKPIADSLSIVYGIPSSVMLGVAIIESGAGKSRNCKLLKNHFGIKGKNNLLKTHGIKSAYKQFASDLASYVAFCQLLTRKKFYSRLKGVNNHILWLDAISKAGYSTVPETWKKNITAAIHKHKLADTN